MKYLKYLRQNDRLVFDIIKQHPDGLLRKDLIQIASLAGITVDKCIDTLKDYKMIEEENIMIKVRVHSIFTQSKLHNRWMLKYKATA